MAHPYAPIAYPARLDAEEDVGFVVTFPGFGVGVTQGDDREEALEQAANLLESMAANYMAEGCDQRGRAGASPRHRAERGRSLVQHSPQNAARPDRSGARHARVQI